MTQQTPVAAIQARKRPALVGGLIGLVAVLGILGYIAYGIAVTPSKPVFATAPARDIIDYISNPRGLQRLSRVEQEKFLDGWKQSLLADPAKKGELKKAFNDMSDADRQEFTDGIFDPIKRSFVDDARIYARTPATERYKFLREKFQLYAKEALFIKEVGDAFKADVLGGQDEQQKWIMKHTTPEERVVCEPYVTALQDIKEQVRKEERNAASQPVSAPG